MVLIDEGLSLPQSIAVGTTMVEVSGEKTTARRIELIITNTSTLNQRVSLGFGTNAVDGVGVVLYPGASYVAVVDNRYTPSNTRITAIASAASGSIAIFERST